MKTRTVTEVALSVAILSVSGMITLPFFAIPFTLQSFAVLTVLGLLGAKKGGTALFLYLLLGGLGLPVFSGFTGGFGILFGPTGGFLFGFLFAIPAFMLLKGKTLLPMILSVILYYIMGSLWYYFLFAEGTSYPLSLTVTVLPFLLPDGAKIALAYLVTKRLSRLLSHISK